MEIRQRSSCGPQILGHPAADGRKRGNAAIRCCSGNSRRHVDEKQGNVRYFGKIFKLTVEFFPVQNSVKKRNMKPCYSCNSCENEKYENIHSALA